MDNYFKLFINDIGKLWNNLDNTQKFGLVVLTGITFVVATFFLMKATEPNWMVLYSDLNETDTAAVVNGLKEGGYPYKISSDKSSVLVPANMIDKLRIYVAENNLIEDPNPGFELLDDLQLGSTDFKNKLTKQRIFQGELTRSIEKMNGIRKARVQLAEPERSVFLDKDETPTASVMLILDMGYKVKANQVKAIKNLVAYAIPRLTPDRVFLTDQNGNTLTDEVNKSSNDMESFKSNFETETAKKVQTVIEKIVGRNNSNVQVSANIDFNAAKSTIESYLPVGDSKEGVLTSVQSESEKYENPSINNAASVSGEEENLNEQTSITTSEPAPQPNETTITAPSVQNPENIKNLNYEKQRNAQNYSVSKEIKQIVYAPGTVKRMTIAVAVNKILTTREKEELKELVTSASGADIERGDIITISSMQFASIQEDLERNEIFKKDLEKQNQQELIFDKITPLAVVFILGLLALMVIKSFISKITPVVIKDTENEPARQYYDEIPTQDLFATPPEPEVFEIKLDPEIERVKSDLNTTVLNDPEEASRLLTTYIKD